MPRPLARRIERVLPIAVALVWLAGCPDNAPVAMGDLTTEPASAGGRATKADAAAVGAACGPKICAVGEVCCNASCGACTPPDGVCTQQACEVPGDDGSGAGATCKLDADCRLFDDYCTGCDCRALTKSAPEPRCSRLGVRCFAQPCMKKRAACEAGRCVVRDATPAEATP